MFEHNKIEAYKLAGPDIVHEEFDGDTVVLNLSCGQYFGMNESGSLLWKAIAEGCNLPEIAAQTGRMEELRNFTGELQEFGLIVPADQAAPLPADLKKALHGTASAPSVECYEDLADLIIADPIHDMDAEAGWPKRPDSS